MSHRYLATILLIALAQATEDGENEGKPRLPPSLDVHLLHHGVILDPIKLAVVKQSAESITIPVCFLLKIALFKTVQI